MIYTLFSILLALLTAGAGFYILFLLYREKGAGHAALGFFFSPYAYVWGWINAKRLKIVDIMTFWTVILLIAVVFPLVMAGLAVAEVAQNGFPGDGGTAYSADPNLAFGSEDAILMGAVQPGGRISGQIDDLFEVHNWTFSDNAGQTVTIRANAASGDSTDPRINLLGPDGALLTGDDDSGGDYNALISGYTLPASGTYTIQVDVWQTGRYEINSISRLYRNGVRRAVTHALLT